MNRKKRSGIIPMSAGLCLIIFALVLTVYNMWTDQRAGKESDEVLRIITGESAEAAEPDYNGGEVNYEDEAVYYITPEPYMAANPDGSYEEDAPLYMMYPEMKMPTKAVNGHDYIGVLYIDELGLELPVLSELTYPGLRSSPCRYKGSAYDGNLIIAAHNYNTHFGRIKNLSPGSVIRFTDIDNNEFIYVVQTMETLPGTAIEEMEAGGWDLSLFTCTYGGASRITIRCSLEMN